MMNKALEKKILDTFSLRIINEYDQKQNLKFHPAVMKPQPYMATRYLQLQHPNKQGKTSGDGRSIWNGMLENNGTLWDVSSRGTGVTCLAPGSVEAQKPLKSGGGQFGYGCGMADVDELLGAAIMAEVFHNKGINTERVLTIIDFGDGNGIGVRAGKNLFRPAHLFTFLKQGQFTNLKRATDFIIDRQYKNGEWTFHSKNKNAYALMLDEVIQSFAQFTAQLDRDYIFAWMDWDGDNVLANAGIIDYGSIRQFGLRHDEYRYDDVERFSTNLKEQRLKVRQIVQTFIQLADYLQTGNKKTIHDFQSHPGIEKFDEHFSHYLLDYFLYQTGLSSAQRKMVQKNHVPLVKEFFSVFSYFETMKTHGRERKVSDGVNRPAIFNMRAILNDLPNYYCDTIKMGELIPMPEEAFFSLILADSARGKDRQLTPFLAKQIRHFQRLYIRLITTLGRPQQWPALLRRLHLRNQKVCQDLRLTGDGLLYVVDELVKHKRRATFDKKSLQKLIDEFIKNQSRDFPYKEADEPSISAKTLRVFHTMLSLIDGHKESL